MHDLTFPYFIELHRALVCPFLQSAKVPKSNNPALIYPSLVLSAKELALDICSNWLPVGFFFTADRNTLRLADEVNSYIVHLPSPCLGLWNIMVL